MTKLTYKQKAKLPKSAFAVKTKSGYGKKGKYPITDMTHARNALARVSAFGTKKEKSEVRGAVKRKFPSIKISPRYKK